MQGLLIDLRVAARSFMRAPGLTATMVLTLALGIGATSAIFTIVDDVLLEELPVPNADELVWYTQERPASNITGWQYSYALYRHLGATAGSAELTAFGTSSYNLVGPSGPTRVTATRVSDTFFRVLGLTPAIGRTFTREEEAQRLDLAVISHEFWVNQLRGDPTALGQSVTLDQVPYEVIGIMPPGANLLYQVNQVAGLPGDRIDAYLPLEAFGSLQGDLVSTLQIVGRLQGSATITESKSELEGIVTPWLAERDADGWLTSAVSLKEFMVGSTRTPLLILLGSVGVLLLMVCVNLSGLLLVRGVGRGQEWATRRALGASHPRIMRQLVTEGGVLSAIGAALGLSMAYWVVATVRLRAPAGLPRADELALDWRGVLFSVALAALTATFFGLMPGLLSARRAPATVLRSSRQTMSQSGRRLLKGLVLVEVALAVVLLAGSGVLLRSLGNLLGQDPGYDVSGILRGQTVLTAERYPGDEDVLRFTELVSERLASLPAVDNVAAAMAVNPTQAPRNRFQIDGLSEEDGAGAATLNPVSVSFFDMLDISVLEGRVFSDADRLGAPEVAVITRSLAERYWPEQSAIGQRVTLGSWRQFMRTGTETAEVSREIVGVVENLTGVGIDPGDPVDMLFTPFAQDPFPQHVYLVETTGSPIGLAPALSAAVTGVDPEQPLFEISALIDDQRAAIGRERLSALVLGGFAGVALLLSGLGIYGIVAYSVVLRRREIGIRIAIGAPQSSVISLFFREGLRPVVFGVAAGMLTAFWAVRFLRGLLYEVSPADPVAFVGTGLVLGVAALASTYLPARRTARVNPVDALRPQ